MIRKILFYNFRIVYRLSQWARHRFTAAGLILFTGSIAAGVFGLDTRQTHAYQIFVLMSVLLIIALISIVTFRGKFNFKRLLPEFGSVGQTLHYSIQVQNQNNTIQNELLLIDELEETFPSFNEFSSITDPDDKNRNIFDRLIGYPRLVSLIQKKRGASLPPVELSVLTGQDIIEKKLEFIPLRRGYLNFNQIKIARPDPLGLIHAFIKNTKKDKLLILPKCYKMPALKLPGKRKYQHGGMKLARSVGDSEEFFSLREYRPGDPMRAIHWRSYAKRGKPVIKEYQDEYFVRQGLVLDTFLQGKPQSIFEEAVSVAASFAVSIRQQDALLDLLFIGAKAYQFTSGRGLAGVENMLEVLACVKSCQDQSINSLEQLLLKHSYETSSYICVFLDWENNRQQLVKKLLSRGIPVHVIVISDNIQSKPLINNPLKEHPENFWVLRPGQIQENIDNYTF